ncbi:hypothetical protein [Aliiruegeria lutimaris]|uniref:Uncharacterized protein n=1 Tax=Aliiruegeria lutimaris TaxID=571298 RepID=A0A1G9AG42_9RHOB|nr:hypothetical protein [Aliiruegeria lutimaris]SDK25520.1 hypothetical protein SAMN04488026_103523 [Aliiruegeria lutimaris]
MGREEFLARVAFPTPAGLVVIVAWQTQPLLGWSVYGRGAEPQPMQPRGDLAEDEMAAIALLEAGRGQQRYVTDLRRARSRRTTLVSRFGLAAPGTGPSANRCESAGKGDT